nr:reverse transcriptase domain-containing protein [Tanacetum cinerariifolium]
MPRECLAIIESKSKVRYSRNKLVVAKVSTNTSTSGISPYVAELKDMVKALLLDKKSKNQAPATVKAVEESCVTCGGAHSYRNCPATDGNAYRDNIQEFVSQASAVNYNQGNTSYRPPMMSNQIRPPGFPLPISEHVNSPISAPRPNLRPSIPYPSRMQDQKLRDKANDQREKFFQIFKDLNFNISFADALILMPKFGPSIKSLLTNKDKFSLADLDASINLMPLSVWNKLFFPDLTPTCMTLELANRSISRPVRVAEDLCQSRSFLKTGRALIDVFKKVFLNDDPSLPPPSQENYLPEFRNELKICKAKSDKSSIDEPPEVELKDLPPHLKYTFLEGNDKFPVIIVKDLSVEEKTALITVLKSHKRAIAWKLSDIKDQEKTTFTYPYGTFAYRRMPFWLCNAPGTFQRCMMAIFHNIIEKTVEVFMDDFLVFGNSFQSCLSHLERMLKRCEDTNLCLNWEKSHFMVKEGIVLGHKISKQGIKVYKAKVDVITKLPYPTTVKGIRSFLGHASFNRRFIKDFSKIARPMTRLLKKDTPFISPKTGLRKSLSSSYWLEHKAYWALKHANFDLKTAGYHKKVQLNELNELRDQAYENSLIYKEKNKRLHDLKMKDRVFNIGDRVLLFNSRLKIFSGKLKSPWSGPFTISQVYPYGTVELSQPNEPNFKVNGHRLKHYFGEDVPKVVVPDLQTFPRDN